MATPARPRLDRPDARGAPGRVTAPATTAALLAQFDTRAGETRETTSGEVFKDIFVPAKAAEDSFEHGLGISELPEPAAFALIGSGLLLLGVIRRRRRSWGRPRAGTNPVNRRDAEGAETAQSRLRQHN